MPEADRRYGNLLVAYSAARQLLPEANAWYREVDDAPLNEAQREWRVRAALRVLAWNDVARAIDAMPESQAQEPAWRYWKARAFEAESRKEDAIRLFGSLAAEPHFYGFLAADAIGASIMPVSEPLPIDAEALAAFGARPAVQRVLRLAALGMRPEAQREWTYIVRGTDDRSLLLAAEFARRNALYDRSINTAERTQRRHDFGLRYQTPYREAIGSAVRENGLDEAWVFGLTRQESRFAADVISSAGAIGLMQLMASTARWIAQQTRRSDYRIAQLENPRSTPGSAPIIFAMCSTASTAWRCSRPRRTTPGPGGRRTGAAVEPLEGAIYAETIPFNETRDYVKKVMANAMFYQAQLGLAVRHAHRSAGDRRTARHDGRLAGGVGRSPGPVHVNDAAIVVLGGTRLRRPASGLAAGCRGQPRRRPDPQPRARKAPDPLADGRRGRVPMCTTRWRLRAWFAAPLRRSIWSASSTNRGPANSIGFTSSCRAS